MQNTYYGLPAILLGGVVRFTITRIVKNMSTVITRVGIEAVLNAKMIKLIFG